jgi:hypothetical protein
MGDSVLTRVYFSGHPDTHDQLKDDMDAERYDGPDERERLFEERWGSLAEADYDRHLLERRGRIRAGA